MDVIFFAFCVGGQKK